MQRKKLAIIGGGGAGTVAAWALNNIHDVKLFESEPTIGGHASTFTIHLGKDKIPVDLGVEYFSEKQAPNLCALLNHFNVETFVAPLSFTSSFDNKGGFWSNNGISGSLTSSLANEFSKFHHQMHEVMHSFDPLLKKMSLGQFLQKEGYSKDFIYKALIPLLTTFSSCKSPVLEYSLIFCALSFSMGFLSFFHPTYWRKALGGINQYLDCISQELGRKIYLNRRVSKIRRLANKVIVFSQNGESEIFDEVIFATHADIALSLLEDPSQDEKQILSNFEYTPIECTLHSDASILIPNQEKRSYCEFRGHSSSIGNDHYGSLTRIISQLEPYKKMSHSIFVTFDPINKINNSMIYTTKTWKIPKLRPYDMKNKKNIRKLQGKNRTWYCGTDTSFTGHEGAILSGLVIAEMHGASYPFPHNNWAKVQFDVVKGLMGLYKPTEKISKFVTTSVYQIAKTLGFHKSQISTALLDLYA